MRQDQGVAVPAGLSQAEPVPVSSVPASIPNAIWETCPIGSCHRHQDCMYRPCRQQPTLSEPQSAVLLTALGSRCDWLTVQDLCGHPSSSPDALWRLGYFEKATGAGVKPRYRLTTTGARVAEMLEWEAMPKAEAIEINRDEFLREHGWVETPKGWTLERGFGHPQPTDAAFTIQTVLNDIEGKLP